MEIKRYVYLNRLIVRKHNGFIKVIIGIRRSGKSYFHSYSGQQKVLHSIRIRYSEYDKVQSGNGTS